MKAAVLYSNEDLRWTEYPDVEVKPNTIKIKIKVAGICGSDIPRVLLNKATFYPIVLGHEFAGEVVEISKDVNAVKIGDRVVGIPLIPCFKCLDCSKGNYSLCKNYSFIGSREQGGFAEYIVLPEKNVIKISNSIPYEIAVLMEPCSIAFHSIRQNNYIGGKNVAIIGVGTIGIFVVQWAKLFGARTITVFDIDNDRLQIAKRFGANILINTNKSNFMNEDLKDLKKIEKEGYDFIFDAVGCTETINIAFEIAATRAYICLVGTPLKDIYFTASQFEIIHRKELRITGSWMSYSPIFPGEEWTLTAEYFEKNLLTIDEAMIFMCLPMSKIWDAFKLYKIPNAVKGKILLFN
jgi:L-iditol 2-dehydrogenase